MWHKIKNLFRSKNKLAIRSLEYALESVKRQIERHYDELVLLRKLVAQNEHVVISSPCFFSFSGDMDQLRDAHMEKERKEKRFLGYSYCHTKKNGDEVWAKY